MNSLDQALILSAALSLISIAPLILIIFMLVKSHRQLIGDYESLKLKMEDEQKLIKDAQLTAHKTIQTAAQKAQEIISGAAVFKSEIEEDFRKNLSQVSQQQVSYYKDTAKQVLDASMSELQNLSKDSAKRSKSMFEQLFAQQSVEVKKQYETYKKQRISELNQTIEKVLNEASLKIINKSLSIEEHEQLVLKALDQARKENGL